MGPLEDDIVDPGHLEAVAHKEATDASADDEDLWGMILVVRVGEGRGGRGLVAGRMGNGGGRGARDRVDGARRFGCFGHDSKRGGGLVGRMGE